MSSILILFIIAYSLLAWRRLDWAMMVILAALPSYMIRFDVFGIPFTVLETMILVAFAVWMIKNYKAIIENIKKRFRKLRVTSYKLRVTRYPFDYEIIALLIISWIAIAMAGFSDAALGVWKAYFFEPILVYILIINVFGKFSVETHCNASLRKILWPLAFSAFFVSLYAILQKIGLLYSPENFLPRVTGPFPYPNALGLYLGPIVMLLIGWLFGQFRISNFACTRLSGEFRIKNLSFYFLLLIVLTSILTIFFAGSEGALAGILIASFVLGLFLLAKKIPKLKNLPTGIIAIVFSFVIFSPLFFLFIVPEHKYFNFSNNSLNYLSDKTMLKDISGEIRKQQWRETFEMMKEDYRWLIGTGLSGYQEAVKPYHQEGIFFNFSRDEDFRQKIVWWDEEYKAKHWQPVEIYMYPHNLMLNFWTELGLLGVLLFAWIIIKFYYLGIKTFIQNSAQVNNKKYIILGLIGAMTVIIVHGLVDVPYFKNDLAVLFWTLISMVGSMKLELKKQKNN
ncbi:O-antigen ligase family protein [Candidatus Parcubacteria bacterium]|nr:O-antigen ligase family protein [Candidatus Parcubacteria bacterium]